MIDLLDICVCKDYLFLFVIRIIYCSKFANCNNIVLSWSDYVLIIIKLPRSKAYLPYFLIGALYDVTYCSLVSLGYLDNLHNLYIFHGFIHIIFYFGLLASYD